MFKNYLKIEFQDEINEECFFDDEDIEDEDSLDEILGTLDEKQILQEKVKIGLHANVYHTISPVKITKVRLSENTSDK